LTGSAQNGNQFEFGRYITGGATNQSGTITVTFAQKTKGAFLQVVELCGNDTSAPIAQSRYQMSTSATANADLLAGPVQVTNFDVYFLDGDDFGATAPTGTPAVTNLFYDRVVGQNAAGTYLKGTASQLESFALGSSFNWGTIAVEIKRP
jgi:hypothetical protein